MSESKHCAVAASLLPAPGKQVEGTRGEVGEEGSAVAVKASVVYVIRSDDTDMVKIGTTVDIAERMKTLRIGNPSTFTILRVLHGGRAEERWMHLRFASLRVRNEWFRFDPEMLTAVPPSVPDAQGGWEDDESLSVAERLARALRRATRGQKHATRAISKASGAKERSVENWLSGKNAMQAEQLMALCSEYDEIWHLFCKIAKRANEQTRAERALFEIEAHIDEWRSGAGRIGDRLLGYGASLSAARDAMEKTPEQRAREAGLS